MSEPRASLGLCQIGSSASSCPTIIEASLDGLQDTGLRSIIINWRRHSHDAYYDKPPESRLQEARNESR